MNRYIHAIAVLAAALMFGCGDSEVTETDADLPGWERDGCDALDDSDLPFLDDPEYDRAACLASDRMLHVRLPLRIDRDMDVDGRAEQSQGNIGSARQAITIPRGIDAQSLGLPAFPRGGAGSPMSTFDWQGGVCPYLSSWTVASPVRGYCVVPFNVTWNWKLCPDCYAEPGVYEYMRFRVKNAMAAWSPGQTGIPKCGGGTIASQQLANNEAAGGSIQAYEAANVRVFPSFEPGNDWMMAWSPRSSGSSDLFPYSGTQGGIKYYGWKNSNIAVNHAGIEGTGSAQDLCNVQPSNVGSVAAAVALQKIYEGTLAHELGHALGWTHTTGSPGAVLMHSGNNTTCAELLAGASVGKALKHFAATLRNSNGLNTTAALPASLDSTCSFGWNTEPQYAGPYVE